MCSVRLLGSARVRVSCELHAQALHLHTLVLVQENRVVTRRKPKSSQKARDEELVAAGLDATKKQQADKREAAKPKRTTTKRTRTTAKAKAAQALEVSYTLLKCTHQGDALQTTMDCMAALQVTMPVRSGTGATDVPAATETVAAESDQLPVQHSERV